MMRAGALCATVALSQQAGALSLVVPAPEAIFPAGSPTSFVSTRACADCPAVNYTLNLWEDGVFYLRREEPESGERADDMGQWLGGADAGAITLFGSGAQAVSYVFAGPDLLEPVDRPLAESPSHRLERAPAFVAFEPELRVRGMYSYMADAASFRECQSDRRFEVAMEADNAAVESAYLALQSEPAEELLLEMEARFVRRPPMEGEGMRDAVVPVRWVGFWPGETCGQRFANAELENSYWKLTRLGDEPVRVEPGMREPHLRLTGRDGRAEGFGGCNRFFANYVLEDERIEFSPIGSTRMACPPEWAAEAGFFDALAGARRWRILRDHLELLDAAGDVLARFEARLMN